MKIITYLKNESISGNVRMSMKPMCRAIMPVAKAARGGGSVVSSCRIRPLAQATTTTIASRNHCPFTLQFSPHVHHR